MYVCYLEDKILPALLFCHFRANTPLLSAAFSPLSLPVQQWQLFFMLHQWNGLTIGRNGCIVAQRKTSAPKFLLRNFPNSKQETSYLDMI